MDITEEVGVSSDERTIGLVSKDHLMQAWPCALKVLRRYPKGLLDGRYSEEDVLLALLKEDWQLWVGITDDGEVELVGICRPEQYHDGVVYRIVHVAGAWKAYMPEALETLEQFASLAGAKEIAWDGRKGWTGRMSKYGYSVVSYEMRKPIQIRWRT